jgi:hypothetical protein
MSCEKCSKKYTNFSYVKGKFVCSSIELFISKKLIAESIRRIRLELSDLLIFDSHVMSSDGFYMVETLVVTNVLNYIISSMSCVSEVCKT